MESPLVSPSDDSDAPDEKAGASVKAASGGNLYDTGHAHGPYPQSNGVHVPHKLEAEVVQPSPAHGAVESGGLSVLGKSEAEGGVQPSAAGGENHRAGDIDSVVSSSGRRPTHVPGQSAVQERGLSASGREEEAQGRGPVKRHLATSERRYPGPANGTAAGPASAHDELQRRFTSTADGWSEKAGLIREGGAGPDGELVLEVVKGGGKECKGMSVLPFVPVTLTFQDVCYFVDMGKVMMFLLNPLAPVSHFSSSLYPCLSDCRYVRFSLLLFPLVGAETEGNA